MAIQFCIIFCTTRQLHSICCHNQWWIWTNCPWWTCWFSEFLSVSVHSQACVCHYSCQWVFSCHSQVCACHYSCQWVFTCHSQESACHYSHLSFTRECLSLLFSVSVSCHPQESACHYSCQWVFSCHSQESACHYSCQWVFSCHSQDSACHSSPKVCSDWVHVLHGIQSYCPLGSKLWLLHHPSPGTGILKSKQYLTGLPGDTYHRPLWILTNCP